MYIGILGPGRLGGSLAALLEAHGVRVCLTRNAAELDPTVDGVLLTVPDDAIADVVAEWSGPLPVLHCSGAKDVQVLRPLTPAGSFHPLMTFPGASVSIPEPSNTPVAIDGDDEAKDLGRRIAEVLGMPIIEVPGDRRLYHAAAVIAGNFGTVLLAHAANVLSHAGVAPEDAGHVLLPLALQSLRNAASDPAGSLTGPVARGDDATIEAHLTALKSAELQSTVTLYEQLTAATRQLHNGKA